MLGGIGVGGEGDNRGWDGWMASLTRWTWIWVNSGSCGWTGRPGVLRFMGSQRLRHDLGTELNWTELNWLCNHNLLNWCFPGGSVVQSMPINARDIGLIPGSGRFPGERNGNPLLYSYLGNPMDRRVAGYSPQSLKRVRLDLEIKQQQKTMWLIRIKQRRFSFCITPKAQPEVLACLSILLIKQTHTFKWKIQF